MKLVAVVGIKNMYNYTNELPIKNMLKKEYKTKHHIYREFRKCVKKGRYGLAMTDDGKKLFMFDTQLIEKTDEN